MTPIYVNDKVAQKLFDLCEKLKVKAVDIIVVTIINLEKKYNENQIKEIEGKK